MATTYHNDIQKLYVAYFNRPADAAGLAYYEDVLEKASNVEATMAVISADFAKSTEYTAAFQGKTSEQIVDIIYTNLFGHAADAGGRKFYADNLTAGKVTVANVVQEVAKGALGSDLTAYNNKLTAAAAFSAAVDTDAEKAGYSGADANAVAREFLAGVTDDASLATALSPAVLNGSVGAAVAAGTPFSVPVALAQLNAASTAMNTFVTSIDLDKDATTVTTAAQIEAAEGTAMTTVANDLSSAAARTLFTSTTTSDVVRTALINDQKALNATALAKEQGELATANANVAKVDGLAAAQTNVTSATAAQTAATKAATAAQADEVAKLAAFGVNNSGTAAFSTTALTLTPTAGGTPVTLATVATTAAGGRATIATGVDATKYPGLTELIASFNASVTADANTVKATENVFYAKLAVNMLDLAADTVDINVTAAGTTFHTEKALVAAIATQVNAITPETVATGATPTVAQIQTAMAVAKADPAKAANLTALTELVNAEQAGGSAAVTAANSGLTSAQSALTTAQGTLTTATTAAATAQTAYNTADTTFETNHTGTVAIVGSNIVHTPTTGSAVTLATIDATGQATVNGTLTGAVLTDANNLVAKFNADATADAAVVSAQAAVTAAQGNVTTAQAAVTAANAASGTWNPLTSAQTKETADLKVVTDAIAKLDKDVAAMNAAAANADKLAGYEATYDAAVDFLDDNGYKVTTLDDGGATQFAGADSDIFVVGEDSVSISAFGLQGSDSVFVGTGYTLVKGAIGATGVKGSDTAMEIFLSTDASGNAQLQIENHAYSSSVTGATGEIVTITLVGIDAATLGLSTDGIITVGTPSA